MKNLSFHLRRLKPVAKVLNEYGCSLALEFIGTESVRSRGKHEFIHTINDTLQLCDLIREENVGLLLDSWHWYNSHGTLSQIDALKKSQLLYVQVNDAPLGVPCDKQRDSIRCLPGETGVIDLTGFLRSLKRIGYDGPVTPEPFPLSPLMSLIFLLHFPSSKFSSVNRKIEDVFSANFWKTASKLRATLPKLLSPSMYALRKCQKIPALEAAQLSSKFLNRIWRTV
jgi:sugar phosphate isomerase/epimerase